MTNKKILVGLSGGVDSAVAAYLLLQQGYEVIGGFMKNYADESNPDCHTREDRNMAIKVAQHLGIKTFIIFDFREEYHQKIINYIYTGYQAGATPNPDVLCNSLIKFDLFLNEAKKLGCDAIATGHYARISEDTQGYHLLKGIDSNKDQSYFLAGLTQHQLSHALFPLGSLTKQEVRNMAHTIGLPNADRKDSQGLCFIGKVDMKTFLKKALPIVPGPIVSTTGAYLGQHEGAHFYTIGQRQGLGLAGGPWYVLTKDVTTNTLIVCDGEDSLLFHNTLQAKQRHRINHIQPMPVTITAKIRYRQEDQDIHTISFSDKTMTIQFKQPQRAVSIGQTVAIYLGDELIGSGIISSSFNA